MVFTTIVVGTDGSPGGELALDAAIELASSTPRAVVHVATAYYPYASPELSPIAAGLPADERSQLTIRAATDIVLDAAATRLRDAGIEAVLHRSTHDPSDAIIEVATEHDADLVIVGSHDRGAIGRAVLGSVSTKVVHDAPCTVLVVRPDGDVTSTG